MSELVLLKSRYKPTGYATDLHDLTGHFTPELQQLFTNGDFKLLLANMATEGFALPEGGQADMVFLPWSMLSDILSERDVVMFIHKNLQCVRTGGHVVLDVPAPYGEGSYEHTIAEQRHTNISASNIKVPFNLGGETHYKWLNIMDIRRIITLFEEAGFEPVNFPTDPLEQDSRIADFINKRQNYTAASETGADHDAFTYPLYEANGRPRATLVFRQKNQPGVSLIAPMLQDYSDPMAA